MNTIITTGHLGADAVVKEKDGRKYITFRMCTTTRRTITIWRSVFYRYSENLLPYLTKGVGVLVIGEEDIALYNGKNGAQIDVSVNANTLELQGKAQQAKTPEPPVAKNVQMFDDNNDEMPF